MKNALATALALACAAGGARAQTTWYVDASAAAPGLGTQVSPYTSIQYAHDQTTTHSGDTLLVAPGTYVENVLIYKPCKLLAPAGALQTTITAAHGGSVVELRGEPTTLEGFTVTGYQSGSAFSAAVYVRSGTGTIRRCIVRDNPNGKGILSAYDAYVYQSTVTGNFEGVVATNFGGFVGIVDCIVNFNVHDVVEQVGSGGVSQFASIVGAPDPGFWDYAQRDLHLRPGSMAIDAGTTLFGPPLDPDGSPPDIGALTYDASYAPAPTVYCTAKINSLGCVPAIGASGHASASGAPFTITCANELNDKLGLLFYGHAWMRSPYQGGHLCVASPVRRTPVSNSQGNVGVDDCSGVYTFDFDALIQSGADPGLVAGELVYAQFWSRDPNASFTTNRSDALSFGIAP